MSQNTSQNIIALPTGIEMGKYRIIRSLGQGGFGMTYLAEIIESGEKVVIKENLPTFCACRDTSSLVVTATNPHDELQEYNKLLTRFVEEARLLAQLDHPNIVKVLGAFEALGTAYYVMPWVGGKELHKAAPAPAAMTEEWLLPILRTMLGALGYLHGRNIYHRDVKPANILLTDDGTPILIDFGTARAIISDRSATHVGSPGYSPIEQITAKGKRGPWTDVYSLGATCYRLITGERPPEATERLAEEEDPLRPLATRAELRGRFSPAFLAGIDKALSIRAKGRWQTTAEWLATLPAPSTDTTREEPPSRSVSTTPIKVRNTPQPTRRKGAFVPLFCVLLLGALGAGGYLLYEHGQDVAEQRLRDEQAARQEAERKAREEEAERKAKEEAERKRQAEADYSMGCNYYFGQNGYSIDYDKAVGYFRKAAEQGHAGAQYNLGVCYKSGRGVTQDYNEAVRWYRKAAEQGQAGAQCNLGVCYRNGQGVTQDYNEAVRWYRKAAEQGQADAQNNLGLCYANGRGVTKDYNEAVRWYRKAAEQGNAGAQNNLGWCYRNGWGVTQDYQEAVRWYRKAAEQGNDDAQNNLGVCYENGRGVTKDYNEAVRLYRKSAEQGNARAQCNLGGCYANGRGVTQDYQEAVRWYRKAAQQGHTMAQDNLRRLGETW